MSKPSVVQWVEDNFQGIECGLYNTLRDVGYAAAVGSLWTGQFYAAGGFTLIGGAAQLTAQLAGCNDPPPPPQQSGRCWESNTPGELKILYAPVTENSTPVPGWHRQVRRIDRVDTITNPDGSKQQVCWFEEWSGGELRPSVGPSPVPLGSQWYIATEDCVSNEPGPTHSPGDPIADPITYEDEDCVWTIQATDAYVDTGGIWHTYYSITANNDACGGPFGYWSSSNGPDWVNPRPDDDPTPPDPPTPQPPDPECDCPPGEPGPPGPPGPAGEDAQCPDFSEQFAEINAKLDAILECACGDKPEKPVLEGQWVTTRWESLEKMDHSGKRLRKLFRYRTKSTRDLGQLSAYWADFSWRAGPVCIFHKGAWWGTPQIWAESEEEGKRVIRFAAAEAGLDPDQTGEWGVSGSRSPRYGMSGTMKIHLKEGFPWVSARDSDSWPNVLARQHDP